MRKIFLIICLMFLTSNIAMAAKFPADVKSYITKEVPGASVRFDGLVTISDEIYLPLYPAKVIKPEKIAIKTIYPTGATLKSKPDVVIFNNDFVLARVIANKNGSKTIKYFDNPPIELRTGLLPQDLLVPRGLVIPDNLKGIIGGLKIATSREKGLKVKNDLTNSAVVVTTKATGDLVSTIPALQGKNFYIITCFSKNIHVMPTNKTKSDYALSLKSIPISIQAVDDKFLMVTTYQNKTLEVISLADEDVIKKIEFDEQPEEIILDNKNRKAYVSCGADSSIYVIDLNTMLLKQKIKVNGRCTKLYLTEDNSKIFYVDENTNEVWVVEIDNEYTIKSIGQFPNVSGLAYSQNKIYILSRTRSRLAIVDYVTLGLINEIDVAEKPVKLYLHKNNLYILSAKEAALQVLDTTSDVIKNKIVIPQNNFISNIYKLDNTNLALITGSIAGKYYVLNLDKKQLIKTNAIDIPVSALVVTKQVKKINK